MAAGRPASDACSVNSRQGWPQEPWKPPLQLVATCALRRPNGSSPLAANPPLRTPQETVLVAEKIPLQNQETVRQPLQWSWEGHSSRGQAEG